MTGRRVIVPCLVIVLLAGCRFRDKPPAPASIPDLFLDLKVSGEEDNGEVTGLFRVRKGSYSADGILLPPTAGISLDAVPVKADSAKLLGVYYESRWPLESFSGEHQLVFTAPGGKQYKEPFEFHTFSIEDLPATVSRQPLVIHLSGFPSDSSLVHVILIDTAWVNNDVNEMLPVVNGELTIGLPLLNQLSNGPISLQLSWDSERRLQSWPYGRISLSYGLRRAFELTD